MTLPELYPAQIGSPNTVLTSPYTTGDTEMNVEDASLLPAAITFSGEQETASPPVTAFTANTTAGLAPLTVQFTDTSTGGPTSWLWDFGDGTTSTEQNPQHTYTNPGDYTVTLTVTNEYGSNSVSKTCVSVTGCNYYQTIEYTACDQDVYQQDIVIHRSEGEAYEEQSGGLNIWHIYVGNRCKEDYGDLRFTDEMGRELAYYLWPDFTNDTARFCVKLTGATILGSVKIWYGNESIVSKSDGDMTYKFFDDFKEMNFDKWGVYTGTPNIMDGNLILQSGTRIYSKIHINMNNVAVARSKISTMGANYLGLIAIKDAQLPGKGVYGYAIITRDGAIKGHNIHEGYHEVYTDFGTSEYVNEYYIAEIRKSGDTNYYKTIDKNGVEKFGSSNIDSTTNKIGYIVLMGYNGGTLIVDYIYSRVYSPVPPSATTFTEEQGYLRCRRPSVSFGSTSIMIV